jgi:hypothetical protein
MTRGESSCDCPKDLKAGLAIRFYLKQRQIETIIASNAAEL